MRIQGLQKMTLLDYPGRVACTVFLGGCDFRCPFCHNFELVVGPLPVAMEDEEFFAFLDKRHGLLDGVAITGGEPCLRRDLPEFIKKIRDAGFPVKLDTNGYHPEMLKHLLDEKLVDYVAMDVKNSPAKYARTIGLETIDTERIAESINLLMHSGIDYEFRTTVVRQFHEAKDFEEIGTWIAGAERYFLQPFTFRDTVPDPTLSAPDPSELQNYRDIAARFVSSAEIRGMDS
ncbi:anaerobic ribonucleoside-triphosphate reductase activating protein [Slackia heliotrinireducens]|uniref:anaerobic ribonucleoside-triphosphate reductase activating protein n=1 Tax=Slackia heliotrinireducens TaxID=84110 RepID=UPI0033147735